MTDDEYSEVYDLALVRSVLKILRLTHCDTGEARRELCQVEDELARNVEISLEDND